MVGTWKNGFIILHQGQARAVGKSEAQHNLLPVAARLIQGEPLRVVAERVAMQGHTLRWLVSRIDQRQPYYLLGEVEIADGKGPALTGRLDSVDTYNPASYRGGILRLHDARAPELESWLDLVASDNLTLARVVCRCPVVGTWKNGFIVLHDGQPRAVGQSEAQHNLLPVAARLIEGEPLRVVAERVAMQGHTLRWLVSRIDQGRPYYLLGEVEIVDGRGPALTGRLDSVESYNPVSYRGGILRLHYARAQELGPWLDLVAVRGEVVVQFWLRPGEAAVTLGPGEEREVERIPEPLRRFLGSSQKTEKIVR